MGEISNYPQAFLEGLLASLKGLEFTKEQEALMDVLVQYPKLLELIHGWWFYQQCKERGLIGSILGKFRGPGRPKTNEDLKLLLLVTPPPQLIKEETERRLEALLAERPRMAPKERQRAVAKDRPKVRDAAKAAVYQAWRELQTELPPDSLTIVHQLWEARKKPRSNQEAQAPLVRGVSAVMDFIERGR